MNTWTEPGRGRKKCHSKTCNLYVPVRAGKCTCGSEFAKAVEEVVLAESVLEEVEKLADDLPAQPAAPVDMNAQYRKIWAIGGGMTNDRVICPFPPEDTTDDGINKWIGDIQEYGHDRGVHYMESAILQMASHLRDTGKLDAPLYTVHCQIKACFSRLAS